MTTLRYGVITKVPVRLDEMRGNAAVAFPVYIDDLVGGKLKEVDPRTALLLRIPVFKLGEILVLDLDGREIAAQGRKPSKWDVTCEEYEDIEVAADRACQVRDW